MAIVCFLYKWKTCAGFLRGARVLGPWWPPHGKTITKQQMITTKHQNMKYHRSTQIAKHNDIMNDYLVGNGHWKLNWELEIEWSTAETNYKGC